MRVPPGERFSQTVDDYDKHRPSYPDEAIDWIVATCGTPARGAVVDLGCGTGIVSRLFAARSFDVVGVDPNGDMLARARERGGDRIRFVRASAASTGLPSATFDLAVAGQAFHWFDVPQAISEIARIVKTGGGAAAFWNVRASTPAMDAYEALLRAWSNEYATLRTPEKTIDEIRAAIGGAAKESSFANAQQFDWDGFRGRVFSSSYVVHGVERREEFEPALRALFEAHSPRGVIDFAYRTKVVAWRIPPW